MNRPTLFCNRAKKHHAQKSTRHVT